MPGFFLKHRVTVEPYLGTNAVGEVYGPAVEVQCMFVENVRMVAGANGEDVSSSSSYITTPEHRPPLNSRVTVNHTGDTRKVVSRGSHTWPGMTVPANSEIFLS